MSSVSDQFARRKRKIKEQVEKAQGKGLNAARIFLQARIKEELSVPAPRKRMPDGTYRATTRAIPGAPPRKLSGRARASITGRMVTPKLAEVGTNVKSPLGFPYMRYHEVGRTGSFGGGQHMWLVVTFLKYREELQRIVGKQIAGDLNVSN